MNSSSIRSIKSNIYLLTGASVLVLSGFATGCFIYAIEFLKSPVHQTGVNGIGTVESVFAVGLVLLLIVVAAVARAVSNSIARRVSLIAQHLRHESEQLSSALRIVSSSSIELSETAMQQAAAIQETAASIDEVSAMAKKSADNASASQKVSQSSRAAAEQGQMAIEEMIEAIGDISKSNAAIMNQVEDGNRQISEIVKVIAEIEAKTKVINDIVFQTKLLSFNASVEAARAGEHGKGFAVVAEEVGNLAQMSGNAAKEISLMLGTSIQKVEGIVNDTKSRVEKLVVEGKQKVESGTNVAQKCGAALENIISTVMRVDSMVAEISSASNEQAQGVSEINKAMNQLDEVVQKNSGIASRTSKSSESLSVHALEISRNVDGLFALTGVTNDTHSPLTIPMAPSKKSAKVTETPRKVTKVVQLKSKETMAAAKPTKSSQPVSQRVSGEPSLDIGRVPSQDDPRFEDV